LPRERHLEWASGQVGNLYLVRHSGCKCKNIKNKKNIKEKGWGPGINGYIVYRILSRDQRHSTGKGKRGKGGKKEEEASGRLFR
jgi:hypothetical protein